MVVRRGGLPSFLRACISVLSFLLVLPSAFAQAPISPVQSWTLDLQDKDEAKNISGITCAPALAVADERRRCLLVSDEVNDNLRRYVRFVSFDEPGRRLRIGNTLELLPGNITGEADVEAADFDEGQFYVAGSHSTSKNGNEYQPLRFFIYRFAPDARGPEHVERRSLEGLLARVPALAPYLCTKERSERTGQEGCRRLQDNGLNIEGLVVADGMLHLGLRAPVLDRRAFVVRIRLDAVFGPAARMAASSDIVDSADVITVTELELGDAVGIRDMARVLGGVLLLTGPALPEDNNVIGSARLFHWAPGSDRLRALGLLDGMHPDEKPEALLVLGECSGGFQVLVLSDGTNKALGGRPTEYCVPR